MISDHLEDLIAALERFRKLLPAEEAAGSENRLALKGGHKLLTAGNWGSAADALHLAEELVGRFDNERISLPAIALCADPTLLTCIGKDYGFDQIYSRQIEGLGRSGDVLVVFSTSGNSPNVIPPCMQPRRATSRQSQFLAGMVGRPKILPTMS